MPRKVPGRVLGELRETVVRGKSREPRVSELVQHFFDLAGGERAVAKMLLAEYQSDKASPNVKSRILDVILRSLQFANAKTPPRDDLGSLSEEDIEKEILALVPTDEPTEAQTGAAG